MIGRICPSCEGETSTTCNGLCPECWNEKQRIWQERMAIRQDPGQFDMRKLLGYLLTQHWQHECEIIPDYMPPHPREDTQPTCQVRYRYDDGTDTWLRYSKGPLQGYFWDSYGEDMHSPELAVVALMTAPPPPRVHAVIPTHGRP